MNFDLSNKRCITHEQLNMLIVEQGQLDIHVHQLQGHYVPFVFFTQPNTTKTPYGPIVSDGSIVACSELDDLLAALEESFGTRATIYAPGTKPPPGAQLH